MSHFPAPAPFPAGTRIRYIGGPLVFRFRRSHNAPWNTDPWLVRGVETVVTAEVEGRCVEDREEGMPLSANPTPDRIVVDGYSVATVTVDPDRHPFQQDTVELHLRYGDSRSWMVCP